MTESTAIAHREPDRSIMGDDEIRRMHRQAEMFVLSGVYKDVTTAEIAFAKMVLGRDLGMTPAQAMQGIHLVKGNIQLHYAMLGQFVRSREGYNFRTGWLKQENDRAPVVSVWHDEEDPADLRPIIGAIAEFEVDGVKRGVSRFTLEDARIAKLVKTDGAWQTSPRNMLLARAISNGVKWFVPEVLAGLPVYVEGEIPPDQPGVGSPVGDGSAPGIDLGPKVDAIIERAAKLEHPYLSNRPALEVQLGRRAQGKVNQWVKDAKAELDRWEVTHAKEGAEPITDAVVVEATVDERPAGPEEGDPEKLEVERAGGRPDEAPDNQTAFDVRVFRRRLEQLKSMETTDPEHQAEVDAEIDHIEQQLAELTGESHD